MNGGDSSPVMTDSERRAYRYGQAVKKSWCNDSLSSYGGGGRATCVCAPTTHPGSFRCKHHRGNHASNLGGAAAAAAPHMLPPSTDDAPGAKHHETAPTDLQKSS